MATMELMGSTLAGSQGAAAPRASFLCMGGSGSFCAAGTCAIAAHEWAGARHTLAVAGFGLGVLVLLVLCRSLRV